MRYLVALFCAFWMLPSLAIAQSESPDVVYLKNGSILRGQIIERADGNVVKLKTAGGNIFVIDRHQVKEIKEEIDLGRRYYKKSGYMNNTGLDVLSAERAAVRFRMVNGYRFSPRFSAGLGMGVVLYNDPQNLIPVFLDLKYKLFEAGTTPFLSLKGGYSFSVLSDKDLEVESHRGGLMLNPAVGIQFEINRDFGLYIASGYNLDHASYKQQQWDGSMVKTAVSYRRLQLGIGLAF